MAIRTRWQEKHDIHVRWNNPDLPDDVFRSLAAYHERGGLDPIAGPAHLLAADAPMHFFAGDAAGELYLSKSDGMLRAVTAQAHASPSGKR